MQIIDAISEVPGMNIIGIRGKMQNGFKCQIYETEKEKSLSAWASKLSRQLLDKNAVSQDELGIIINASISLYDTTALRNTSAPGVGHEVQKHLNAKNAFVFEMFHNDLGNMIKIASDFLSNSEHKYALIIQSNKFSDFLKDDKNGFCIPDGVNALLLKLNSNKIELENIHILSSEISKAGLSFNAGDEEALKKKYIFRLNWNYSSSFVKAINSELKNIFLKLKEQQTPVITEKWFSEHLSSHETENTLAMNTIPWYLQENKQLKEHPLTIVSYNPFLAQYSVLKITNDEI
ncbi:hypothetical protein FW781_17630 [Chryseobacterium panacisoli]|uniref:Uncharacterized protein n=1 Tax=Chryseobacterium panacisoli TaxID=1807141 RepID=A0A5D8ZEU7_9FLAO|nr:hypothetical protein [Chryseobacterium panacisoli]TZF93515.1 hypothetical protein FW781_17630 [Chryseobacterium panacisoli]